ncbi:outer membrane protein assembly factor BamE [Hydrogenophaga pseudoflava]|uniref:outer membrane protein assembly factor BamE n=1 Tax=Hydrogenophaga pseudoflava TaxID=47421 RepID=UPI0027E4EE13|nr:outer membrane protein assembly factor BamE [Hydrogenophaga pseudoflava]MDQ7747179.1 outer membrane protein assembly factor BamE [Hydrogenophaga pseudoflava]
MRLSILNPLTHPAPRIRRRTWQCSALVVTACLALGACSSVGEKMPSASGVAGLVTPYKVDVLQGNVVTREQVQALQPGLARDQVRGVLGSPLLTSVFHADRWDYVFTLKRQGQPPQQRRVTVFFKGEVMDRIESDELPSETEFVSSLDARRKTGKVPPLEATEEQLKAFQARNAGSAPAPAPVAPAAPTTAYPPLEPAGAPR